MVVVGANVVVGDKVVVVVGDRVVVVVGAIVVVGANVVVVGANVVVVVGARVVVVVVVVGVKSSITELSQNEFNDVKRIQVVFSSTVHKPKEPIVGKDKLVQSND